MNTALHHSTSAVALGLCVLLLTGCAIDGDTRGAKRGAVGGALIGLTMGALAEDTEFAVKGAIAGGVVGGVAGSMSDLESDREAERTKTTADAIVGRGGGQPMPAASQPQTWERLDTLVGTWTSAVWGLDEDGQRVTATATWKGTLDDTRTVRLTVVDFDADGFSDDVDDTFTGHSTLSFTASGAYELTNAYSLTSGAQRWVGERMSGAERYSFYYVGSGDRGLAREPRSTLRVELRFVGNDVFIVDTLAPANDGERQVQSYRFTRSR